LNSTDSIERDVAHRPWPLPSLPWVMFQSWRDLLFAHWRMPAERLRPLVPAQLALDEFDGSAWVALTPFLLADLHARGLPALPRVSTFPELNLRTYVRVDGKPGVWFFSLDAGSALAVSGARLLYRLPYHLAEMRIDRDGEWIRYHSRRERGEAELSAAYRPTGAPFEPVPGTLEHFLVERYALYTVLRNGRVLRAEIHHPKWLLQPAQAEIERNTVGDASGVALDGAPAALHFAGRQDTLVWPPELLRT
jgi:hypothetical protein